MNSKKILGIIFAFLLLIGGFGLGLWLAYRQEVKKQEALIPPQKAELLYREKKAQGQWDEKTLILENLKIFAGEKKAEAVYGTKTTLPSITPIKRRAEKYLQEGQDEQAKAEIRRLLKKIFGDFSKRTSKAPLPSSSWISEAYADGRSCFESLCFNGESFSAAGYTNHLYIEETVGENADFSQAVREAVNDSITTYQGLGLRGRRAVVVVMPSYYEEDAGVEASAAMAPFLGETVCLTHIWGNGINNYFREGSDYFKQVLAHEIFHCFQGENFPRQMDGPSIESTDWWVEGTADYFSNVVYPGTNAEYVYDGDFDSHSDSTPLYRMSYEANVFWQDFANQSSDTAIFALITSLPTSGGSSEQQAALAGLGTMPEIFHQFAEHYLDRKIRDSSGALRSLSPNWGRTEEIREPRTLNYEVEPFVIGRKKLHFDPRNQLFNLRINESSPGKYSSQKNGQETWGPLPERIGRMSCDESEDSTYKMAQTKVAPSSENYNLEIQVSNSSESASPPPGVDPNTRDHCLLGNWQVDASTNQAALASILARVHQGVGGAGIHILSFNLNASGCFMNDGSFAAQMDYSTQVQVTHPRFNYHMAVTAQTQALGSYASQAGILHFWNMSYPSFAGSMTASSSGISHTQPFNPGVPLPVDIKYNCSGDRMQIQIPTEPYPWISLNKIRRH